MLPATATPATVYDCAFLDLDGVVYTGSQRVEGAADALTQARALGMRLAFVTNNALRTPAQVAEKLGKAGVAAQPRDIITSAQAVAAVIAERHGRGARVLIVGGEGLAQALTDAGLRTVETADDHPDAVAQGFGGPDMPFSRFTEACLAINAGALWYASNPDPTIPTDRGAAPGNGAAIDLLRTSTGSAPVIAGKPYPPIHQAAVDRTHASRPLCVGDRLDTDIAAGHQNSSDTLLVLTGVTDAAQLIAAPPAQRPTYIAEDLADGLLRAHPAATREGGRGSACNGWLARIDAGTLRLEGEGSRTDALRALCHAAWTADGDSPSTVRADEALDSVRMSAT
ncbi:HAD-IIA family hydrolase [Streptomyces sp. NBC_00388]|uniref:HAD-IIA family hydrolase n=1 Tax=Streptomyces sp. NBC_00388 TaxID=2975735 RepID=UPI00324328DF